MPAPYAVNLEKVERLQLVLGDRGKGGDILTPPRTYATAVINVISGTVCFTIDSSNPLATERVALASPGQSINITHGAKLRSIVEGMRIITAPGVDVANIVAWYFD